MNLKMGIINSKLITTNYENYYNSFKCLDIDELNYLKNYINDLTIIELINNLIIEKRDNILKNILDNG